MSRLIDADALEKDGWCMTRNVQINKRTMEFQTRKPTDFPTIEPEPHWIPVKMRPMNSEEREFWEALFGYELDNEDAVMFDCQMPEDGQEILISFRKWINMDKCEIDGGCYGLEGNGDWEGVIAWMPLPPVYKEDENEGDTADDTVLPWQHGCVPRTH